MAEDNNNTGRTASYTAPFLPLYANNQGQDFKDIIKAKWKCDGAYIFTELQKVLCGTPHYFIKFQDEDDKFLLYKKIDPAPPDTIDKVIEYLAKKKVIDPKLFKAGIIYSPFFVKLLSSYYKKNRPVLPRIPQIDDKGNIKLVISFPFDFINDKFYYGDVDDIMQLISEAGNYPAGNGGKPTNPAPNRTKDNNNLTESKKTSSNSQQPPSKLEIRSEPQEYKEPPAGAADLSDDGDDVSHSKEKECSVSASVQPSRSKIDLGEAIKKASRLKGINKLLYPENGSIDPAVRTETGKNWNNILYEAPFMKEINKSFNIEKKKLIELYNKYGRERMLACYAYTLLMDSKGKVKSKPSGYFIKAITNDYQITEDDELSNIEAGILERNPEL